MLCCQELASSNWSGISDSDMNVYFLYNIFGFLFTALLTVLLDNWLNRSDLAYNGLWSASLQSISNYLCCGPQRDGELALVTKLQLHGNSA